MSLPTIYDDPSRYARQEIPADPYTATLEAIAAKYGVSTAADFGCGLGVDTALMLDMGLDAWGYDGSESLREHVLFDPARYRTIDLREEIKGLGVDLIWCREVAEHIPAEFSDRLVENIVRNCRVCYFTAAPPGQVGSGHINCQPRALWEDRFRARGFTVDNELTDLNQANPDQDDRINGMVLTW